MQLYAYKKKHTKITFKSLKRHVISNTHTHGGSNRIIIKSNLLNSQNEFIMFLIIIIILLNRLEFVVFYLILMNESNTVLFRESYLLSTIKYNWNTWLWILFSCWVCLIVKIMTTYSILFWKSSYIHSWVGEGIDWQSEISRLHMSPLMRLLTVGLSRTFFEYFFVIWINHLLSINKHSSNAFKFIYRLTKKKKKLW